MPLKTQGVLDLVQEVLHTMPMPYGEDVIEDVCLKIEHNSAWKERYDTLGTELPVWVVNNWIGQHVKNRVGMESIRQVPALRSEMIASYTKLAVRPERPAEEAAPRWLAPEQIAALYPDIPAEMLEDMAATLADGTDGSAPAASVSSRSAPINRIPSDIYGDCTPLLLVYCFDEDGLGARLKAAADHAKSRCPGTQKIVLVTSQWQAGVWRRHQPSFRALGARLTVVLIVGDALVSLLH